MSAQTPGQVFRCQAYARQPPASVSINKGNEAGVVKDTQTHALYGLNNSRDK
jgi:hypothetical protein